MTKESVANAVQEALETKGNPAAPKPATTMKGVEDGTISEKLVMIVTEEGVWIPETGLVPIAAMKFALKGAVMT